jgi:hypothetical protein
MPVACNAWAPLNSCATWPIAFVRIPMAARSTTRAAERQIAAACSEPEGCDIAERAASDLSHYKLAAAALVFA